ncbi:histone deacetylase complex subunit cti6 [Lecanosticta acicola]|uniref:Histone deacetylase complex subunit cti6 n=1 Tax=Lecanosticta acicola TaxID=111012 RepID=A0AAI8Z8D4_9PEZI|nr:histone deacetylase complex subunit cti6 [Lecanosticta acicola]
MPSPVRRSARGAQPAASSTTSSHSSRQDRGARANQTHKSATPRSLSSEEVSEPPVARRSQRQPPAQKEDSSKPEPTEDNDNDGQAEGDDEITRCICGYPEYPGLPSSEAFKHIPSTQLEDAGALFISCDGCDTWQHGGCVGIIDDSQVPDRYFCFLCQPKMHAIRRDSKGQDHSLYLPLHPNLNAKSTRKASVSKHDEKAKKERELAASRASVDPLTGKRRGTTRSRNNDEELEQLYRAIEESKREGEGGAGSERRSGKRGRDESCDDNKQDNKRQRRSSDSAPSAERNDDSDDAGTVAVSKTKKAKAEAALSARQAEQEKKDKERDKARSEAAGRRQERARSRRNDEADANGDTTPKPTTSDNASPPAPLSQPASPPPAEKAPPKRGPGKKPGKKLGNNQYTKNRFEQSTSSPHGRKRQNHTSGSGDDASEAAANVDANGSHNGAAKNSPGVSGPPENGTGKGKFGRGKKNLANGNGAKGQTEEIERTFTNMQAVLKNMSAFVTKEQDELTSNGIGGGKSPMSVEHAALTAVNGTAQAPTSAASITSTDDRRFEDLSSAEMAEKLQKGIENWQRTWGHLATA